MANVRMGGKPVQGGTPNKEIKDGDYIVNPAEQKVVLQAVAELDLTDDTDSAEIIPENLIPDEFGGDVVVPVKMWAYVTEEVAADQAAPVVTIEAGDGTDSGLALTFTDGDAVGDVAIAELANGDAVTAIDLDENSVVASVTTAATDAATATGKAKVVVEFILIK